MLNNETSTMKIFKKMQIRKKDLKSTHQILFQCVFFNFIIEQAWVYNFGKEKV